MKVPDDNEDGSSISVPRIEEDVELAKRQRTRRVLIRKRVEEHEQVFDEPLASEEYRIERVPKNEPLDAPASIRHEGETLIIPVMKEVAVIRKQLMLAEELRITKIRSQSHESGRIVLKREIIDVEKSPPGNEADEQD
jgi:uncharacterized protein (TIGR02271 family)